MTKLHELTGQYLSISDEDLPPEAIADTLEAIEGEIQLKGENIGLLVQNWQSDIDALKEYKKQLDYKIQCKQNRIDNIKEYLRGNMEASGIKKIECPLFNITCGKGRAVVSIDDEDSIPDEYMTVTTNIKPDKKKLLDALKGGEVIEGVSLTESKSTLRIK